MDKNALDRYITGNYGDDQYPEEPPYADCKHLDRRSLGKDQDGVYQFMCRGCGDLFDSPYDRGNDPAIPLMKASVEIFDYLEAKGLSPVEVVRIHDEVLAFLIREAN